MFENILTNDISSWEATWKIHLELITRAPIIYSQNYLSIHVNYFTETFFLTELEDQVQSLENERTLSNEYLSELQAEYDSVQAEKEALAARVEGLENTGVFNQAAKMELDSLQMKLEESMEEKEKLQGNLEFWKEKYSTLESEVAGLQNELARAAAKDNTEALISATKTEIDSLHMVLEESMKEKQQLQENLASWKEK